MIASNVFLFSRSKAIIAILVHFEKKVYYPAPKLWEGNVFHMFACPPRSERYAYPPSRQISLSKQTAPPS